MIKKITKKNPFRYGIAVDDPYFVDRVQELMDFDQWLTSGQSLVIYSSRRYGKTSLILKLLKQLEGRGYKTVYVDFFKVYSRSKFVELYYKSILEALPSWEKSIRKISALTKSLRPVFSLDQDGRPLVSVEWNKATPLPLDEVLDLPQKLAVKKPWIVVFDEFQEINDLNGENFEKEMRASMIHHDKVSYVFQGSQSHMLLNMFTRKNRAFYQFGKIIELKKIPEEMQQKFLEEKFRESGIKATPDNIKEIISKTDNIPHYVQYLASAAWEHSLENDGTLDRKTLEAAIDKVLINQNDYYLTWYEKLTAYQKKVLHAIHQDNKNIFNAAYTDKYRLHAVSSVQRAVERFIRDGVLEKKGNAYIFTDPFFPAWLEKMQ